jgi:hypothetical protein
MATTATHAAPDLSHVSEVLEVAHSVLQRDQVLTEKTLVLQEYLEISKMYPERDYREGFSKALADLTAAVHLHLNAELAAIGTLFRRLRLVGFSFGLVLD